MKKSVIVLLAAIVVIVIIAAFVIPKMKDDNNTATSSPSPTPATPTTPTTPTTPETPASPSTTPPTTPASSSVTIQGYAFSPSSLTVKKGTTVTWTNQDDVAHTVTVDSGDGPKSGNLNKGQTYSFTFNTAGTFSYHCTPHPYMKATVTVTE